MLRLLSLAFAVIAAVVLLTGIAVGMSGREVLTGVRRHAGLLNRNGRSLARRRRAAQFWKRGGTRDEQWCKGPDPERVRGR
jgi:hypothetical protein